MPLGLFAVWLVACSRRLEWRRPGALACLGAAAALGAHNPYCLYFWLQLLSVPKLVLPPGVGRFKLAADAPANRVGPGRNQLRSFGLSTASVKVLSRPGTTD